MRSSITSLIRRIVGRINKVKLVRSLLFAIFLLFFAYLSPALSELFNVSNWGYYLHLVESRFILLVNKARRLCNGKYHIEQIKEPQKTNPQTYYAANWLCIIHYYNAFITNSFADFCVLKYNNSVYRGGN